MNLFLCSRFCNVGTLIKENLQNKRIAFIPTAAAKEGASRYVLAGRELLSEMGAIVTEIFLRKTGIQSRQPLRRQIAFTFQEAIRSSLWMRCENQEQTNC